MADDLDGRAGPDRDSSATPTTEDDSTSDGEDTATSRTPDDVSERDADESERSGARTGRPEVVVPMDLYKTVTVFSTLFSIALVVGGMIALDAATARASRSADEVHLPIALLGVAAIVLGAGTYAFAARFRAEGMGNPKDADDEG